MHDGSQILSRLSTDEQPPTACSVEAEDQALYWLADILAEQDGLPIEYAFRVAQEHFKGLDALIQEGTVDTPFYRHEAKFELGNVVATPAALEAILRNGLTPAALLSRHANCDWGDLEESDKALNDEAVKSGEDRILSVYELADRTRLYVITEYNRTVTTILLNSEY